MYSATSGSPLNTTPAAAATTTNASTSDSDDVAVAGAETVSIECPFGIVGLAFPSQKDPNYKERHPNGGHTGVFVCGDVPWSWFQKWADSRVHHRGAAYDHFKASFERRLMQLLVHKYPQLDGKIAFLELGTPCDVRSYLGRLDGGSYGIPPTVGKAKADADWLRPEMPELLPKGMFVVGQDVNVDGFATAVLCSLMCVGAIDGPLAWLDVVPMLGGIVATLKIL